ncbi:uncharacterized protein TNIN_302981 [Trichonephila inaurata madagascariensis]|uniref:Uncharacterized protein n=1 Tax=Trichonephila inaurata madagascariensis TaxID=2747483 RepID=A0A8X6XJP0_9ARAC|nr:uncharacterized protein TNIN_302981 [Trichonephila inaurata madagascariensis]
MGIIVRRRQFTILILICSISLFIFGWHSRTQDTITITDIHSTYKNELIRYNKQISGSKKDPFSNPINEIYYDLIDGKKTIDQPHPQKSAKFNNLPYLIDTKTEDEYTLSNFPEYEEVTMGFKRLPDVLQWVSEESTVEKVSPTPSVRLPSDQNVPSPIEAGKYFIKLETNKQNIYPKLTVDNTTQTGLPDTGTTTDPNLILDTPGCKVPKLDPWDPSVRDLIELQNEYICPGPPLFMKSSPDGSITLNETILEEYYGMKAKELLCEYQPIFREHEPESGIRENSFGAGNKSILEFGVPLNEDYIGVGCHMQDSIFEQFFSLVRLKEEVEEKKRSKVPPTPRLNVILAGIDSVSKLNFLRHFPRSHAFLHEKLTPFEMNGYTKVGDNTFPNLIPMLTGHFVEHYWNESMKDTMFFDDLDLIWKNYAERGYRTFYAEDSPYTGTFNYLKRGFYDPPTDYYFRPVALALEYSNLKTERIQDHCLNSQLETDMLYDYLRDFLKAMENRPHFAFAMVSTLTHDVLNWAGWADAPTLRLLEDLSSMGALNNSFFVLFSDHGIRFGEIRRTYIGKFEERMPLMYIHFPKWFLDQYPVYAKNLRTNQNRLMTLFDIHATMVHLLDLNKPAEERSAVTLGQSLLEEISPNRTCDNANILQHWCPCQTLEVVASNSTEAVKASQAIVDDINSKLEPYSRICETLEVDKISDARVGQANDLVLRFLKAENWVENRTIVLGDRVKPIADYMITLVAKPGGAVFEATVRHDPNNDSYKVMGISRISLYGTTSWCIDSQKMKIYCYCKDQHPL